jgi:hypothetical protein
VASCSGFESTALACKLQVAAWSTKTTIVFGSFQEESFFSGEVEHQKAANPSTKELAAVRQ